MRLLIGGSSTFLVHLKKFSDTLNSLGVESKLVFDGDYADGFPSRKIGNWFQTRKKFNKLIDEFKPDAIFVDRQRHFGINALKANIPLFVLLRGHYWSEIYWNKRTMYKPLHKRIALWQWNKLGKEIFNDATAILPICKYLEKITNKFVPGKPTQVFFEGVDASRWYQVKGRNLLTWGVKFDYDIHYVEHHNFLMDLKILFKTFLQVVKGVGVRAETQEIMPEFMGSKPMENKGSSNVD